MEDISMSNENEEDELDLVALLIEQLKVKPEGAVELVHTLSTITKPWEAIGNNGNIVNEVPVPQGQSATQFIKQASTAPYISGYRMNTIFGDEVASITKDTPKWRVKIEGENQVDAPFVQHGQKAEANAKKFAEDKLRERGFIIG